ncbi:MAG: ABC transporter ATP-binding protein [Candidatus Omnitrophica bacterium]|nr:ABC transporter ATP-binding protein [Candidatus Omnitrophota bacterium]
MLTIENLSKSFGGVRAVDGCSFTVSPKQITALIGPNGAGKTTVFQCISGLLDPDRGRVVLGDRDLGSLASWDRARSGISRTFQQVQLWTYLTVSEHLLLSLHTNDDQVASVFGHDTDEQRAAARTALERVGLPTDLLGKLGSDLSYGQSKLLELARAFLFPHQLLLLDEPVAGVNPILRQQIAVILQTLLPGSRNTCKINSRVILTTEGRKNPAQSSG